MSTDPLSMKIVEYFPIVTETGELTGKASRTECHSGSFLLHPVVHLHIFNSLGELYLQKRAGNKDIQPNKWDTSVGGHIDYGEKMEDALRRETREELGIHTFDPILITRYKFVSDRESELIYCHYAIYDGDIYPDPVEISEGKFWKIEDVKLQLGKELFTPNFEQEFVNIIQKLVFIPTN